MKHSIYLLTLVVSVLFQGCDTQKKASIQIVSPEAGTKITFGQPLNVKINLASGQAFDSIVYMVNGNRVGVSEEATDYSLRIDQLGLGRKTIKASLFASGQETSAYTNVTILGTPPVQYGFKIVNQFPHKTDAFTQGLEFHDGVLYESTGRYEGQSSLRKVDYKTGQVIKQTNLGNQYFAEGITFVGKQIYQLTYREQLGMVYNAQTFEVEKTFRYFKNMEGWGLCYDNQHLIMTDGSSTLYFVEPQSFTLVRTVEVFDQNGEVDNLNELEYVNGKIYANVYTKDYIIIIDPITGLVEGKISLAGIHPEVKGYVPDQELNGIAYHPERKTWFVTGKTWNTLYEIELVKR
jgi:glutamine cyclotransferase